MAAASVRLCVETEEAAKFIEQDESSRLRAAVC